MLLEIHKLAYGWGVGEVEPSRHTAHTVDRRRGAGRQPHESEGDGRG